MKLNVVTPWLTITGRTVDAPPDMSTAHLRRRGQWCYNNATCMQRQQAMPYLTSSWSWYKHMYMSGIFDSDPERSPFAGANLVYAGYCSSDAWCVPPFTSNTDQRHTIIVKEVIHLVPSMISGARCFDESGRRFISHPRR